MSISFSILGSGSSGNSTVVTLNGAQSPVHLLIDCGLSPRQTNKRLAQFDLTIDDISAILVTHFDTDHFHMGWPARLQDVKIAVHVHKRHRSTAGRACVPGRSLNLHDGRVKIDGAANSVIEGILLAHDDLGTCGFVIEHDGVRLGFATDLGIVPHYLHQHFVRLDAIALESNYDRDMQDRSARPAFLKRRIMGGRGHLSNDQALQAILQLADCCELQHIALLHLSRQCNCPRLVQKMYAERAGHLLGRLTITNQFEPTPMLRVERRQASPSTTLEHSRSRETASGNVQFALF